MDRFSQEDSDLITSLVDLSNRCPELIRSSEHLSPADKMIKVRSWRMDESKYYAAPSPFPTLARGLFSVELPPADNGETRYRIVARGYDKFFNIGEVPWTTWESLAAYTAPPYTLSVQANGCIIFVAALTPEKLLITSKHSLGPVAGMALSHAQAAEHWLRRYLAEKGKTEADLAGTLWKENWTAIAELCDDSFEEHVLPHSTRLTGLHLHGLNHCGTSFRTMPQPTVDAFADEWGFIRTRSLILDSIGNVREFIETIGATGTWDGEAIEGFVIRSVVTELPPTFNEAEEAQPSGTDKAVGPIRSSYAPGSSFFFRVKFDEPYMMYRNWREVTKMLLRALASSQGKGKGSIASVNGPAIVGAAISKLSNSNIKRTETKQYADWVFNEIQADLRAHNGKLGEFAGFGRRKGIIQTREKFFKWLNTVQPSTTLAKSEGTGDPDTREVHCKTIIVTIGVPGFGKTSVCTALGRIFGFGHTQSDDIRSKDRDAVFVKNVVSMLENHDVVIADKNNHLKQRREALRDATGHILPPVKFVALNWNHVLFTPSHALSSPSDRPSCLPLPTIHRLVSDRISARGAGHQTLVADRSGSRLHEDIVWLFIDQAEPLSPDECDEEIQMCFTDSLEQGVHHAVDGLCRVMGLEKPNEDKIKEGIDCAMSYEPSITKAVGSGGGAAGPESRYFAILPEIDVLAVIERRFQAGNVDEATVKAWEYLKSHKRVTKRPHITLVHRSSLPGSQVLWDACVAVDTYGLSGGAAVEPFFEARLEHILWDGRVMAMTVETLCVSSADTEGRKEANHLLSIVPEEVRRRLHITIGTWDDRIQPVEAMKMVETWRDNNASSAQSSQIRSINIKGDGELQDVIVIGRLRGMNHR